MCILWSVLAGVYLPDLVDPEQLPGYEVYPGQDVGNDNYLCPGSLQQGAIIGGCRLNGTVTVRCSDAITRVHHLETLASLQS